MTQRKPPNVSFPGWVERQIRSAEARGAFDNLSGAGKPIDGIDRPHDDMAWIASYLRREDVDVTGLLPPGLALAKEVEQLDDRLDRERSEMRARAVVLDLNDRIGRAHAMPQIGPPLRVRMVDVDDALERWSRRRPAPAQDVPVPTGPPAPARTRRRWWRRVAGDPYR